MFSLSGFAKEPPKKRKAASEFHDDDQDTLTDSPDDNMDDGDDDAVSRKKSKNYVIPISEKDKIVIYDQASPNSTGNTESVSFDATKFGLQVRKTTTNTTTTNAKDSVSGKPLLLAARENANGTVEADEKLTDYVAMPVEYFGDALLKGMGWKEGETIGRNPKRGLIEPVTFARRHNLLGLGADPDQLGGILSKNPKDSHNNNNSSSNGVKPKTSKSNLLMEGQKVVIVKGKHAGLRATVTEHGNDIQTVTVTLSASREELLLPLNYLLTESEYAKQDSREGEKKSDPPKDHKKQSSSKLPGGSSSTSWLLPNILVRIVSKSFCDGKYFNRKAVVEDITSPHGICILRLENGEILENVRQSWLETCIPKSLGSSVIVVKGPSKGSIGVLIEKNSARQEALIQLGGGSLDLSLQKFHFDDICKLENN